MGSNAPGTLFNRAQASSTAARCAPVKLEAGSTLIGMTRLGA
jgi:hypothetical protein